MSETRKRLEPRKPTLRELYLKSGNRCAFPGCSNVMINEKGTFIGQVCHIEAAKPGGERFNENMTNEQCRSYENLMLMCYRHHKVTDDVTEYPVQRLQEMKANHEGKFTDIAEAIRNQITDHTREVEVRKPKTLQELNNVLEWGLTDAEAKQTADQLGSLVEEIKRVPKESRRFLSILVERSGLTSSEGINLKELEQACRMSEHEVQSSLAILDRHGIAHPPYRDRNDQFVTSLRNYERWPVWEELRQFCEKKDIPVEALLVELRFDLLD